VILCCSQGYDVSLSIPGESLSSWSSDDEALLLANLESFYGDPNLYCTVSSRTDLNGVLVVVVNVFGFSTSSLATSSSGNVSSGGLHLSDSRFSSITATASTPSLSCDRGFSTADSSNVCTDTDACFTVIIKSHLVKFYVCLSSSALTTLSHVMLSKPLIHILGLLRQFW
jgi:hypothetical protein